MSRTAVLALGGNALARAGEPATIANQFRHARESIAPIVELARDGWEIAIVHGNGPQVGDELTRNEVSRDSVEPLPQGVLVAETAGWIGYMLQQSLQNALARAGIDRAVATIVTQTLVDPADPALAEPSKPIGHALTDARAEALRAAGVAVKRDGAGQWRRVARSPRPLAIVEAPLVLQLVREGVVVIAAGGGGPPV
jgi:carbamate kinase